MDKRQISIILGIQYGGRDQTSQQKKRSVQTKNKLKIKRIAATNKINFAENEEKCCK